MKYANPFGLLLPFEEEERLLMEKTLLVAAIVANWWVFSHFHIFTNFNSPLARAQQTQHTQPSPPQYSLFTS
jgi:hypothetical protein